MASEAGLLPVLFGGIRRLIYFVKVSRIEHDWAGMDTQVFW